MVLSDVSIRRPVFATVISLMLVVLGVASFFKLPIREYPAIDPPIVSVSTAYTGAANDVVESRVTQLIESAVSGIEGITRINSTSREERSNVSMEFRLGRDIADATADVRDKVSRIIGRLPEGVQTPVIAKVDSDQRPIIWFTLRSDRMTDLELTDYIRRYIIDRLSIIPGVASVNITGERKFSMRIWLDRQALAARGLTVDDVEQAVRRQNISAPGGRIESNQVELTVKTDTRLNKPEQFANIILANRSGTQIRLAEVARIEVGAEDSRSELYSDGKISAGVGVLRQSTGNTLSVANAAREEMAAISETLPEGMSYVVAYDESQFISTSIHEVMIALGIGIGLVVLVIFIFLRSVSATLIPAISIPVSVIATCTVLAAFGFSINVLTLLALVLAIGIVVDDAIVVLENIHRRIEEGEPVLLASVRGSRQITFAVISTTLTLIAVFVPISFMTGNTGRLFTEFGIALAAAVMFSGLTALSLTPMLCSKILRPHDAEGWLYNATEKVFQGIFAVYRWLLTRALNAPLIMIAAALGISALSYQFFTMLPKELAPTEDRGVIFINMTTPEGASLDFTRQQVRKVEALLVPFSESVQVTMSNLSPSFQRPAPVNEANVQLRLKPWEERKLSQLDIVKQLTPKLVALPGVRAIAINPPSLGSRGFGQPLQVILGGSDYETLKEWRDKVMAAATRDPRFVNVDSNFRENKPELRIRIDRQRAADLGLAIDSIGRTLETLFGGRSVSTYVDRGEEYSVVIQGRPQDRSTPTDIANVFVRPPGLTNLVPLANVVSFTEAAGPANLNRVDRLRTITVSSSLAPGFTLPEAIEAMNDIIHRELPPQVRVSYGGQTREYIESSSSIYFTFLLALLVVFLVLAAQFESWIHPFIIMLAVPLALTGGLGALVFAGMSLNVYSQIGMILLVGLMTKNGILIVEFANQLRSEGRPVREAVFEASVLRLRPILMTSFATVMGAVPLAIAQGAGAESRLAIGWVIIGGVSFATVLTVFIVPVLYTLLAGMTKPANTIAKKLSQLDEAHKDATGGHAPAGHGAPAE